LFNALKCKKICLHTSILQVKTNKHISSIRHQVFLAFGCALLKQFFHISRRSCGPVIPKNP